MARIELKYCTIHLRDGLKGTAVGPTTPPVAGATGLSGLTAVATNRPYLSTVIPIGARLRVAGETTPIDHVVTARVDGSGTGGVNEVQTAAVVNATGGTFKLLWNGAETPEIAYNAAAVDVAAALAPGLVGATANISVTGTVGSWTVTFQGTLANSPQPLLMADISNLIGTGAYVAIAETTAGVVPTGAATTAVTISPALTAGTYAASPAITIKSQDLNIKIGEGNLTYTEHRDYQYLLDRGMLDTVREPKDVPMDVKTEFVYEHITSDTTNNVSPMDALKGMNSAVEWVSSAPDGCEPYCIDILVEYDPPCAPVNRETTVFPMFRAETREINYNTAVISLTGKCNVKEPNVYIGDAVDSL